MTRRERRKSDAPPDDAALRDALTEAQLKTLQTLEPMGWTLEFLRQQLFQEAIAVVSDAEGTRRAVLEPNGMLNENQEIPVRE
ncbi:hypothetical protein [Luteimonas vadosa]